jgi:hypothetical protein
MGVDFETQQMLDWKQAIAKAKYGDSSASLGMTTM